MPFFPYLFISVWFLCHENDVCLLNCDELKQYFGERTGFYWKKLRSLGLTWAQAVSQVSVTRYVIRVVTFFVRVPMARGAVFGLTSSRRGRGGGFRGNWRRNARGGGRSGNNSSENAPLVVRGDDGSQTQERFENARINDEVDEKLGFVRLSEGPKQEGWLVNMHPVRVFFNRCA